MKERQLCSFITVKNLNFKYPSGTENVLNDISLKLKRRKSSNYWTKWSWETTLVKMLNGLLKPTSGDVIVDEWNTQKYSVAKMSKKVGMFFKIRWIKFFITMFMMKLLLVRKN